MNNHKFNLILFMLILFLSCCTTDGLNNKSGVRNECPNKSVATVEFKDYMRNSLKHIGANLKISDKDKETEFQTFFTVKVKSDGKILDIEFEKESKSESYNKATYEALKAADPFPVFRKEMSEECLQLRYRFSSKTKNSS